MLSMPPATTTSLSPVIMDCAPSIIAFIPDAHTLLIVVQATELGKPAKIAACLAGAWPTLACSTLPINTSVTSSGFTPAFANAPFIAIAPNLVAEILAKLPPKLPIGVRTADTIYTSFIICVRFYVGYYCLQLLILLPC